MRKLTQAQKDFLLEHFFKNEKFAGWRGIAEKLLDTGKCIVAGDRCIWIGGVGNYITTKDAENAYNCLEYTFNLEGLLSSEWYKQIHSDFLDALQCKINSLQSNFDSVLLLEIGKK